MTPQRLAGLTAGWFHYAWMVTGLMFCVLLITAGVRAAPSILIVPLEHSFGWSRATISAAISLNIFIYGLAGPFAAGLMQVFGLKRTILLALSILTVAVMLSGFITAPWMLFATWGVLVGLGTGTTAGGQLVFLPILAKIAEVGNWRTVSFVVAAAALALIPLVLLILPETARDVGLLPYGATKEPSPLVRPTNPFSVAIGSLARASHSVDFWLLFASFWVCGFSTNGLIGTHLVSYCMDNGIGEVAAAGLLAMMGMFDLVGTTLSGWLTDRYNSRILLFWYYGLRGLALLVLPLTHFDPLSLGIFSLFYGLDWIATVPPTVALANEAFGRQDAPVIFAWILAGHQIGAATAAAGAGLIRTETGRYMLAGMMSGVACLLASALVLRINRKPSQALEAT